jgi:hypothetical protein
MWKSAASPKARSKELFQLGSVDSVCGAITVGLVGSNDARWRLVGGINWKTCGLTHNDEKVCKCAVASGQDTGRTEPSCRRTQVEVKALCKKGYWF